LRGLKSNVEFDENASLLVVTEDFGTDGSHGEVRARKKIVETGYSRPLFRDHVLLIKGTMKIKITAIIGMLLFWASFMMAEEKTTIRFGHFPNITHAQGVIAHALSRQRKGWFEKSLGPNVEI